MLEKFGELLDKYIQRSGKKLSQLEQATKISRDTLERWRRRELKRGINGENCEKLELLICELSLSEQEKQDFLIAAECFNAQFLTIAQAKPVLSRAVPADFFYGRELNIGEIINSWIKPMNHIAVVGAKQSGKTSLLHYIKEKGASRAKVKNIESPLLVLADFQGATRTPDAFAKQILKDMQCEGHTFEDLQYSVRGLQVPVVWLLDNLDKGWAAPGLTEEFWWGMRAITQNNGGNLSLCVASSVPPAELPVFGNGPSPMANVFVQLSLKGFTREETDGFMRRAGLPPEEVAWLYKCTGGMPALLQKAWYEWQNKPEKLAWKKASYKFCENHA